MSGLRIKIDPNGVAARGNIGHRNYQISFPVGDPVSTSGWMFSGLTPASSFSNVSLDLETGDTTTFPSVSDTSTCEFTFRFASCAKVFGIRSAKLLPHF